MIFATIGTQAPFDRFIKMLDELVPELDEEVIAQTNGGSYQVKNMKTVDFISPDVFDDYIKKARLIVAHAGMGTIITALKMRKPIVVVPRWAAYKEHRTNHQMATASRLKELGYIHVAYDKIQLRELLFEKDLKPLKEIEENASANLISSIAEFIRK